MAAIRRELAAGGTKTQAARDHNIGTVQRLNRLLAKWPAPAPPLTLAEGPEPPPADGPPPAAGPARAAAGQPPALSDAEVAELLAALGLDD